MCWLSVGSEGSLLIRALVWFHSGMSVMMFSGSGVWVGFIVPLGIFLWSDASIAFVMRW